MSSETQQMNQPKSGGTCFFGVFFFPQKVRYAKSCSFCASHKARGRWAFARLPEQAESNEEISIFSRSFPNEFFQFQVKRLFQMTCSFKGNNSVLILWAPPPFSLASVSFPIFHLPLPTRISRDSPLGTPSVVPSGGWPAPGPGSRNQMLLLLWPHSSPFRALLLEGLRREGQASLCPPGFVCYLRCKDCSLI